jgi:hypothetical protein
VTLSPCALLLFGGLGFGLVGAATATDMVSLREVAHTLDVPVLSGLVIALREAMPTSLAHALEPATAVLGGLVATGALTRPNRYRANVATWFRGGTQRTVLALGLLRVG